MEVNYYQKSLEIINSLSEKKNILLHACCGVCSCFPIIFLAQYFNITILYSNSNIYPENEFKKRLTTLQELLSCYQEDENIKVNLVVDNYNYDDFMTDLRPYKDDREGGRRCYICIKKRMKIGYEYAYKNNFDYFTTTLTFSREKNSLTVNKIGEELEKNYLPTKYFYSNFKKSGGQEIGRQIRLKYQLYYQNYCGCEYSYLQRQEEIARKNK